ncbi:MAG: hypothetical protein U0790_27735 [Isosphaeraceae bacterium]
MTRIVLLVSLVATTLPTPTARAQAPRIEAFLVSGKLADGEAAMVEALKADPKDDQARFGLGVVQFLRAVEGRMQAFYRHGLLAGIAGGGLLPPLTNLPIAPNPRP